MIIQSQIRVFDIIVAEKLRDKVKNLDFSNRLGILLKMRLSGVAEQI
jgi:hypothetical protein